MNAMHLPFEGYAPSPDITGAIAARFSALLEPGDMVLLQGGLGAGKTTFVRALCHSLGIDDLNAVSSPTYSIHHHYPGNPSVDHLDLYRLGGPSDFYDAGLEEALDSSAITLVEWPDRVPAELEPQRCFLIQFGHCDDQGRTIHIRTLTPTEVTS